MGAGVIWEDVVDAAAPHGLYALHGSSPTVGVAGYSLGGGMGWLARSHGLQTNSLTAIELVTADGELVRTDADNDPELFWALRGGGGNFGIVTALEFRLYPVTEAYAGFMVWDWSEAERVIPAYVRWAATAPDDVTTSLRIMQLPPLEEIPAPIRGRSIVLIDGAVTHDPQVLGPLRGLNPEIDTFATVPAPSLVRLHQDPEDPVPYVSESGLLRELTPEAIRALAGHRRPGLRLAADGRRAASGRRRAAPAAAGPRRGRVDRRRLRPVRARHGDGRGHGRVHARPRAGGQGGDAPVADRGRLPQLRRGDGRHRADLRQRLRAPARGQGARRPGKPDPRQPRHSRLPLARMGRIYDSIDERLATWIARQPLFFVGTSPSGDDGHVNVSPKGPIGSLRVIDEHTVAYLDIVGSGAETIAHLRDNGRICVMFCAFEGPPRILRLHGEGDVVYPGEPDFAALLAAGFDEPAAPEARRAIIRVRVSRVADSCGYGVPLMSYEGERPHSDLSTAKRLRVEGPDAMLNYQRAHNLESIDGLPAVDLAS